MDVDLGVRTKSKSPSLQLDYPIRICIRIHIDEVKPWPPSPSARTPGAVVIRWEQMQMQMHGDGTSGFTKQVVPAASDGRIEFNESFGLKVGLMRLRGSGVSGSHSHNNKCIVEFNLYEHDRIRKGRLLGTAVLDLAALALAYGSVIKEDLRLSLSIPIHCKCKSTSRPNSAQPLLFLKIEASNSMERKKNHGGSVSATMTEEYFSEKAAEIENEVLKVNDYPPVDDIQKRVPLPLGNASFPSTSSTGSTTRKKNRSASDSTSPSNLGRIQQLEHRIKILERELREAAGLEVSLYSVVAEHGSSMNKVHAPARRLTRLYFKHNPSSKSLVSGLISAAKACGNDVPRLTFWLSNTLVLRAIISSKSQNCLGLGRSMGKGGGKNVKKKWESFPRGESVVDKENLVAFVAALEKAESWIFSRIIESLWWQTFTPRMQTGESIDSNKSKSYKKTSSSIEQQQQGNFSVELWKKAFRDACERICPVRGGGHDCGCLPLLSKLIMEQVVARLDVAMLNGILRVSADEIPTDPVADPISDANVLPIPAGKASFGAGVRLKNAVRVEIGNWSRWLSDLFDMDDENSSSSSSSSKSPFYLLNALSELMMLPKDMLLTPSIRKQVCPTFGLSLLTRILKSFVPDEFCPDPVPVTLVESLNSQNLEEKDSIVNLPCEAAPIAYKAPSVAIVMTVGVPCKLTRSGSSLLNKSQTSDDELDQLDSPLKPITGSPPTSVRYQLLRQIWNDD